MDDLTKKQELSLCIRIQLSRITYKFPSWKVGALYVMKTLFARVYAFIT